MDDFPGTPVSNTKDASNLHALSIPQQPVQLALPPPSKPKPPRPSTRMDQPQRKGKPQKSNAQVPQQQHAASNLSTERGVEEQSIQEVG